MASEIWVNIGSGNGLLPGGTKPLPEPMLTNQQLDPVTFIWWQLHKIFLLEQSDRSGIWQAPLTGAYVYVEFQSDAINKLPIPQLRDFTRSYDKASYRILKRGPGRHML